MFKSAMKFNRRYILAASTALPFMACTKTSAPPAKALMSATEEFAHGVASGDMTQTSAIIWTRWDGDTLGGAPVVLDWDVCLASDLSKPVKLGKVTASAQTDYTAKVDVTGLTAGRNYIYRFSAGAAVSAAGRFSTLPAGKTDSLRFAVVSCCNWESGFFNVYDHIAKQDGLTAVLHLGDYFYEYGHGGWGGDAGRAIGRLHEPATELLTLADYRTRHAQYRTDPALQAMTAAHPLLPMWDDHETANDSWAGGAQNHNEGEGEWEARKAAALRAYYEWMPVRDQDTREDMYKAYSFGDLLTLVTVETRLSARSEPINIDDYTKDMLTIEDADKFRDDVLNVPDRRMMDDTQTDFVVDAFSKSKAAGQPWRLLANQVILGKIHTADLGPYVKEENIVALEGDWPGVRDFVRNSAFALPLYPDSWDGYPWAREQFYARLKSAGITDMLVVTGDAHEYWANNLTDSDGTKMGVELGTTSVTSPTLRSYFGDDTRDYALLVTQNNKDVKYYNAMHNGYIDLFFTRNKASAKLVTVDTISSRDYAIDTAAQFAVRKDGDSLKFTSPKGLNFKQRVLFSGLG